MPYIDDKDLKLALDQAECKGVDRARNTLSYIYKHKASKEKDPQRKMWYEEQACSLLDNERWNLLDE